jgi:transposase
MLYAGCDLHKQSITVCVVDKTRQVLQSRKFLCQDEAALRGFFAGLGSFEAVVEATAGYEWFVRLIEPLARRAVLAHPKKMRVIAESTRKSDKLDAQVLAQFLAMDMVPASYCPTPRQRDHRRLVRQRDGVQRRITSVKNRMRRILSNYNADIPSLFTREGMKHLAQVEVSSADGFALAQMIDELTLGRDQLKAAEQQLKRFAQDAPQREAASRELLRSIPGVGFVTAEVVLAELADVSRFHSQKQVVAYAGLSPGQRESAGKSRELHLEKNGSKHLRWALIEAAWRLVRHAPRWKAVYDKLKARVRPKKAITAVARRLLCMMTAILNSGECYSAAYRPH